MESIPRDPKLPVSADKKRKTPQKARLVSYRSQDDSQDETASRRSGRKRTAVTKMARVINYIASKNDRKEGK